MAHDTDISEMLAETVRDAAARKTRLAILGSGSKRFYAGPIEGEPLDVSGHRGIVYYESTELVLTARAGTPLADIETTLAEKGQMLGFEPPYFGTVAAGQSTPNSLSDTGINTRSTQPHAGGSAPASERASPRESGATLGGAIACGFYGPRRPYAGAARDFVLGTRIINGKGEILKFGGQVMKNVAGYDVSRLMVGAFGTLGVLLDVSLKVLPKPAKELTLYFEMPADKAITTMNAWAGRPLPLSAACHLDDTTNVARRASAASRATALMTGRANAASRATLYVRLSGTESGVRAAHAKLGGEVFEKGEEFWRELREHECGFFQGATPLWRLSVPPATPPIDLPGKWIIDWGGAQRWFRAALDEADVCRAAHAAGGYATLFRGGTRPTTPGRGAPDVERLNRNLRKAFDPFAILNSATTLA